MQSEEIEATPVYIKRSTRERERERERERDLRERKY
jgi:hypothetical protein